MTARKVDKKNVLNRKKTTDTKAAEGSRRRAEARDRKLAKFRAWCEREVKDGDTLLCGFENADLSHPQCGSRVVSSYWLRDHADLRPGITRLPDRHDRVGWRYVLRIVTTDPDVALQYLSVRLTDDADLVHTPFSPAT